MQIFFIFFLSYYWRIFKVKISKNSSNKKVALDRNNNFSFRWPYPKSPSLRRYPDPKLNFPYLFTEERSIFPLQLWKYAQELKLKTYHFINGVENWNKLYNQKLRTRDVTQMSLGSRTKSVPGLGALCTRYGGAWYRLLGRNQRLFLELYFGWLGGGW